MADNVKLGLIVTGDQQRDAIHVAVAPVVASQDLNPGDHVNKDGAKGCDPIGIVDPFLKKKVKRGQTFWLLLYPNTVIGMRHHWIHPVFDGQREIAEQWLRKYALRVRPYDEERGEDYAYHAFMDEVRDGRIHYYGTDCHCIVDVEDADELFCNLSIVLGRDVNEGSFTYSCSC